MDTLTRFADIQFVIRQAEPADRRHIVRLVSNMDNVTSMATRFEWMYEANPHGPARSWVAVDKATEEVVACTSFFPRRTMVDGRVRNGVLGGDCFVDPKARRRGLATALHRAGFATFGTAGVDFMYGPPAWHNLGSLVKAGAHHIGDYQNWVLLLGLPPLSRFPEYYRSARRRLAESSAKSLMSLPGMLLRNRTIAQPSFRATLRPVTHFDERFDRLFETVAPAYGVVAVRDREYLNWRYLASPSKRQIPYGVWSADRLIGLVALEILRDRASIIDLFTTAEAEVIDGVLHAVLEEVRGRGCSVVNVACNSGGHFSRRLEARGFRPAESLGFQISVPATDPQFATLTDPKSWHFTMADGDMDTVVHTG